MKNKNNIWKSMSTAILYIVIEGFLVELIIYGILAKHTYNEQMIQLFGLVISAIINIVIVLLLKVKTTNISFIKFLIGIFIYGLPCTAFCLYFTITSVIWINERNAYNYAVALSFQKYVMLAALVSFAAGLSEEIMYRGLILNFLLQSFQKKCKTTILLSCVFSGL